MKANSYSLSTVFGKDVRYVVPLYQRPYVWERSTHWEPLWDDFRALVHRLIVHEVAPNGAGASAPHFMGAIVLEQQPAPVGSPDTRLVIDGQQRLTTLQLLLAAAARVAAERGFARHGRLMRALVENNRDLVIEEDQLFKVWPTNANRAAFRAVMAAEGPPAGHQDDPENLIDEAHAYFVEAIDEWLSDLDDHERATHVDALVRAVRELVKIVVIELEEGDNAQVIFETLNARGTPLLAVDLVKNLVFQRASSADIDLDRLYRERWAPFDGQDWRQEVRQGRLRRPRAEFFLMHWLAMQRGDEVSASALYPAFRLHLDAQQDVPIEQVVEEFAGDAALFRSFERRQDPDERRFFATMGALDTSTVFPLALALLRIPEEILPADARRRALQTVESFVVRRMLCSLTTKNYNQMFLSLVRAVQEEPLQADEVIAEVLAAASGPTAAWPRDDEVVAALRERPAYGWIAQARLVVVLGAVERRLRTPLSEAVDLPAGLTIEHVMPRSWREHWPVEVPGDVLAEQRREQHVNRIGNLTLVTDKLNPALSNASWAKKRAALNQHSALLINRRLADEHPDHWDEDDIDRRSEAIARLCCEIWPGPPASESAGVVVARPDGHQASRTWRGVRVDDETGRLLTRRYHEERVSFGDLAAEHGLPVAVATRAVWAWEPVVYPHTRLVATPADVVAARDDALPGDRLIEGEPTPLRWDRIAERAGITRREAKALYDQVKGPGAAARTYTGRGRRYAGMD